VLGSGLLTIIGKSTSIIEIIGFEVVAGFGFGMILNLSESTWNHRAERSGRTCSSRLSLRASPGSTCNQYIQCEIVVRSTGCR
jgi:hypothetical protein